MSMPALFKGRLSIPVIGSPLFIISVPDLVIAQCKAGVVGSFPALNARPPALLDEWLARITEELAAYDKAHPERPSAPFAVNQIVHKSNNRLDHDLAMCEKHKVPMMITSLGAREELNQAAHGWGGIVFHDVINQKFAHKAVEKGADGLILVAAGAGGHAGDDLAAGLRRGDAGLVRRSDRAVGRDRQRPRHPRRAHSRRRLRLYRLRLHRDRGSQCGRGLQADDHVLVGGRHRLFQPVHRRARQLSQAVDRQGRSSIPTICRPPIPPR